MSGFFFWVHKVGSTHTDEKLLDVTAMWPFHEKLPFYILHSGKQFVTSEILGVSRWVWIVDIYL